MIKQTWNISEDEKNRILNLHESATKRMYLSEQNESQDLSYYEIDGTGLKFKVINAPIDSNNLPNKLITLVIIFVNPVTKLIRCANTVDNSIPIPLRILTTPNIATPIILPILIMGNNDLIKGKRATKKVFNGPKILIPEVLLPNAVAAV